MLNVSNCENVFTKPHHRMPHRVIKPPDAQCSNLLAMEKIYHIIENIYVIISVEKFKENAKWEMHGKP